MNVHYKLGEQIEKNIDDFKLDVQSFKEQCLLYFMEKNKYRLMWALRSIEKTIKDEGGIITVNEQGHIEMNKFSDETIDKMKMLIAIEFDSI
jgi:hypothetical protein